MIDFTYKKGRALNHAMDDILGLRFPVLEWGFISPIDYLGNDRSVAQAARISYRQDAYNDEKDRHLINYMLSHGHGTPFEMCEIKFHICVPMDTWRQWIRHRTANVNEISSRYSVLKDRMEVTDPLQWRTQSRTNHQGSGEDKIPEDVGIRLSNRESMLQGMAREIYNERLDAGVAKEQARKDLPLSTYTEAIWKSDLRNLMNFLKLRMDSHAQQEIRMYANQIYEICKIWVPWSMEAFNNHVRGAMSLSQDEQMLVKLMQERQNTKTIQWLIRNKWLYFNDGELRVKRSRKYRELADKLIRLGMYPLLLTDKEIQEGVNIGI